MKIINAVPIVIMFYSLCFISCQEKKHTEEQTAQSGEVTTEGKTEVLKDTVGLYKLGDTQARTHITKLSQTVRRIEDAMARNSPDRMPGLMQEIAESQKAQVSIQSGLSEPDRVLFKTYIYRISARLDSLSERMANM